MTEASALHQEKPTGLTGPHGYFI